jgi:hypothetical protein
MNIGEHEGGVQESCEDSPECDGIGSGIVGTDADEDPHRSPLFCEA